MTAARAVEAFIGTVDAAAASYMEACVHCGQCAQACHFYETNDDPRLTPIYKIQPLIKAYKRHKAPFARLRRMLGLAPPEVTDDELNEWSELVYDTCTMCGRCTLVCPMGIDIAALVRKTREGFVAAGIVPEGLVGAAERAVNIGSPLGIKPETLRKIVDEQSREVGIPIPLDEEGADYLVVLSAMELLTFYEVIGALARIFHQAGVSWTISTEAYEATNVGIQMGDKDIARTLVRRIVDAAEKLKVKYVISPECGHAYTALKWEGPNLVGRSYRFRVLHILEFLDQLQREGRIRTSGKDTRRVTYHDPCQIVRRGGVIRQPRAILNSVSDGFVEMKNAGVANICCGGGGGVSSNPRAEHYRLKAFAAKKKQIDEIEGIEALVTSCANCRNVLEEAIDTYGMELPVLGLVELLAAYLEPEGTQEPAKAAEA